MGTPEIFLEHKKSGKKHAQKVLRVKPSRSLFVIGSSRDADLHISGEGVSGCHAALRYRAPHWYVCDISGTESVKVNDKVVSEARVDGTAKIEIAGHRIQLFTKERDTSIFKEVEVNGQLASPSGRELSLQQVVIRSRSGRLVQTKLLKATETFSYTDGEKTTELPAPRDGKWVRTELGTRVVQQRLVPAQEIVAHEPPEFDRDLRKPLAMALTLLVILIVGIWSLTPKGEEKKIADLDKKSMDIIFNAKAVKKKKLESQKVVKAAKARAGGTSQSAPVSNAKSSAPEESMAPKVTGKPSAVVNSLRQSGLSNLIGKIAKRANKQGVMVAAVGVSPDKEGAGRAFYSTGTSTVGGGGSAAKEGPMHRLGGIATRGKAGGMGNAKDGTALAGGSVGSGDIVALSDEESVVEGGLDKDAIAEVIKRNLGQIRYCYERQLSSNPELYGKVLVKWTIGAGGEVMSPRVDGTTLKSSMVEGCILRRMASWQFPLPKGGTQVNVSYPFLFKPL